MKISKEEYAELIGYKEQREALTRFLKGRVEECKDYCDIESILHIFGIEEICGVAKRNTGNGGGYDVQLPV